MTIEMEDTTISAVKSTDLLRFIVTNAQGPREAYGLLCLAIWRLNFELCDDPVSIDVLVDEVSASLRSIIARTEQ